MYNFKFIKPENLEDALNAIKDNDGSTMILAGGTDLLLRFRSGKLEAKAVVDVCIPQLQKIFEDDEFIHIGPSVSLTAVVDRYIEAAQPMKMIAETCASVGSCQTRNLATIGGNFCTGNASADVATALIAAHAKVEIRSAKGKRVIAIDDIFVSNRKLSCESDEIVTDILIPKTKKELTYGADFFKVGKRKGHVIAALNVAAMIGTDKAGVAQEVSLAAGTLAPRPIRLPKAEAVLRGQKITEALLEKVAETMLTEISPRDSLRASKEYRLAVAPEVLNRVIRSSVGMEEK